MTQIEPPQNIEPVELENDEVYLSDCIDRNPSISACIKETAGLLEVVLPPGAVAASRSVLEQHRLLKFEEAYKVTSGSRGRCLIISNRTFKKKEHAERIGTDIDSSNLRKLFQMLGYTVDVQRNRSASDILGDCSMFLRLDFEHQDSCVLCILSHGYRDCIIGSDSQPVKEKDILDLFDDPRCKLKDKPKLVILQACRIQIKKASLKQFCIGSNTSSDTGNEGAATGDVDEFIKILREQIKLDDVKMQAVAISRDDLLIAYSTLPGALSWKNQDMGSWFVQAIVQVFAKRCATEHVADMLVTVSRVVREASNNIQVPHAANRLYKKFYFFLGV